jgi:hypothetical protein
MRSVLTEHTDYDRVGSWPDLHRSIIARRGDMGTIR